MSNRVNHSDDLFRQRMEDFREMPPDQVWAGVADALAQRKKKRRLIIWFWSGGLGFAASVIMASLLFNPVHQTQKLHIADSEQQNITAAGHNLKTTEESLAQGSGQKTNTTESGVPSVVKPYTNSVNKNVHNDFNITETSSNPTLPQKNRISIPSNVKITDGNEIARNQNHHNRQAVENNMLYPIHIEPTPNIYLPTEGMKLVTYPAEKYESPTTTVVCTSGTPRFRATISVYGYGGGIAYQRNPSSTFTSEPNTIVNTSENKNKRFGLYAATAIKAGFIHRTGIYMNLGVGYETQRFSSREQFQSPGITNTPSTVDGLQNSYTNTSFGLVSLPFDIEETQMTPQSLDGKLIYQSHYLFLPVDLGYSFTFKRFGIDLGTSATFHLPVSQKAIFYPDQGKARVLKTNIPAAFNFSLGFEPSVSYHIFRGFSIMAGGTFRYHLLDTYKDESNVSRPYVLAGNLGLKYTFNRR